MAKPTTELLAPNKATSDTDVIYMSDTEAYLHFENLYLRVREKEGRIYPDSIVKNLPHVERNHPLFQEWQIRAKSSDKLVNYLAHKSKPMTILELGCGNGWLANRLAQIHDGNVYAVDLNTMELEQGARVFSKTHSLRFIFGNIFDDIFQPASFDLILLASSIQYFSDIQNLIRRLLDLLRADGEIHIIDSPFYTHRSAAAARQRSIDYYQELGFPEMANYYHHHLWTELDGFHHDIKHNPESHFYGFRRKFLGGIESPFPWIVIRG